LSDARVAGNFEQEKTEGTENQSKLRFLRFLLFKSVCHFRLDAKNGFLNTRPLLQTAKLIRNPKQTRMKKSKIQNSVSLTEFLFCVGMFGMWDFAFVSDFVLRISNFGRVFTETSLV
jgi:hypothetical protein